MGKKNKAGVGQGILKARTRLAKGGKHGESWRHTSELNDAEDWKRLNISSITEQSHLDDFLATAELAGTEFTAEKLNVTVVTPGHNDGLLSAEKLQHVKQAQEENKQLLRIPRRPPWTTTMDVQELDLLERESLLEWRRQLAELQEKEHIILTPFEKNLEFWRQLWRVIERSDVIVQIVDARNPLLFRCEDLEVYVKEKGSEKANLLLINKADLLTPTQRSMWASYFKEKGICVAFWSALTETERLQEKENQKKVNEDEQQSQTTIKQKFQENDESKVDDAATTSRFSSLLIDNNENEEEKQKEVNEDEQQSQTATKQKLKEIDDSKGDDDAVTITSRSSSLSMDDNENEAEQGLKESLIQQKKDDTKQEQEYSATSYKMSKNEELETSQNATLLKTSKVEKTANECEKYLDNDRTEDLVNDDKLNGDVLGLDVESAKKNMDKSEMNSSSSQRDTQFLLDYSGKILTSDEFIELCQQLHQQNLEYNSDVSEEKDINRPKMTTIGMVGYPNVGKSSTINAILQHKRVSVSATPGKTKHYQTLNLSASVCLCDCPGLVFPSFVSTKAEMVVNGILPIDQMRDHVPPVTLVCQRIPREVLEAVYGINIAAPEEGEDPNRAPYADELLNAYGYMRGYMTSHGTPDCPRSSRYILKDYVKGKLLYCTPPPGVDGVEFQEGRFSTGKFGDLADVLDKKRAELSTKTGARPKVSSVDQEFFAKKEVRHFVKGKPVMVPGLMGAGGLMTPEGMMYKPWKKHNNRNKKEKIRRLEKN